MESIVQTLADPAGGQIPPPFRQTATAREEDSWPVTYAVSLSVPNRAVYREESSTGAYAARSGNTWPYPGFLSAL